MPAQPKERSASYSAGGIVINVKCSYRAYLVAQLVKNLPAMQKTWIQSLGQEYPPGGGLGNPLQYSCLENPMDRGTWRETVHRASQSRTQTKQLSMHA